MSEGIKRMLAERAALAADLAAPAPRTYDDALRDMLALIDKAAPYIDEGSPSHRWRPSELIKLAYFAIATSDYRGARKRAVNFVTLHLHRARELWLAGYHPDPFSSPPRPRPKEWDRRA